MEKEIKKIIARITGVMKSSGGTPFWMRATKGWFLILFFGTGCAAVLCGIGVYEFFSDRFAHVKEVAIAGVPAVQGVLTKEYVEKVMNAYNEKKMQYISIREGIADVPRTGGKKEEEIKVQGTEVGEITSSSTEQTVVEEEEDATPRM